MVRFLGRDIHFPRGYGPRKDSSCWFTPGVLCSRGEEEYILYIYVCWMFWFTMIKDITHKYIQKKPQKQFSLDCLCQFL